MNLANRKHKQPQLTFSIPERITEVTEVDLTIADSVPIADIKVKGLQTTLRIIRIFKIEITRTIVVTHAITNDIQTTDEVSFKVICSWLKDLHHRTRIYEYKLNKYRICNNLINNNNLQTQTTLLG